MEDSRIDNRKSKNYRTINMYVRFCEGKTINKTEEAQRFGEDERSIQRDIDDIRNYLELEAEKEGVINNVIYDRTAKGYKLEQIYHLKFTNPEILAICKILLDSRAFTKKEMDDMLQKLIESCVPKSNQSLVRDLISNEAFHYIQPKHNTVFMDRCGRSEWRFIVVDT